MDRLKSSFEQTIKAYADHAGTARAYAQARHAGIELLDSGQVLSWSGDPLLVVLRLIRSIAEDGDLRAVTSCVPLIGELERLATEAEMVEV